MSENSAVGRPFREGLFILGETPSLIGSQCRACGERQFPARDVCSSCRSEEVDANVPLAGTGKVYSFTVVRQAPPGRPTPYTLAYVDLDDGVRVMAQVDPAGNGVEIGDPMRVDFRAQDGTDVFGYVFVPLPATKEGRV
ncbi:Zn-ribbon domain-containing OB-fold protein [Agrobacterium sp. S2]|nr:Zn-ribbon domain-containing OB-fold protein [Agrobacterium sp. S2]